MARVRHVPGPVTAPRTLAARLLCEGVAIGPALFESLEPVANWLSSSGPPRCVELELEGNPRLRVSAPVRIEDVAPTQGPRLIREGPAWLIERMGVRYPVLFPPRPRFSEKQTSTGQRMGKLAWLVDSVLFILPTSACSYALTGSACRFCRVGSRSSEDVRSGPSSTEVAEVVRAAAQDERLHHVLFSALPSFDLNDGGVAELEPLVRATRRHTTALVGACLHPPRSLRWLDHAYAVGVDVVGIHLEVFDVENLERVLPGRARYLGKSRYMAALRHAVRIFPRGGVWTEIVVGWQPLSQVLTEAEGLIEMGVVPFLVPFRNWDRFSPFGLAPPSAGEMIEASTAVLALLRKHELSPIWLPELPYALPLSARSANPSQGGRSSWEVWTHRSSTALFLLTHVARVRRALRVRAAEELFAEAGHGV